MPEKILFVDDDPNILSGFQRMLRGRFQIDIAAEGAIGIEKVKSDPSLAVIVSDYRMPGMTGVEFLSQVAQIRPDSVRILLTGEADTKAAGAAVNQGQIFRFLLKPCPALVLEKNLNCALDHYRLLRGEKELLEQTLRGSMQVLIDLLSMVYPHALGKSLLIAETIQTVLRGSELPNQWEFELAGLLSQIGVAALPVEILDKIRLGNAVSDRDRELYSQHGKIASRLLSKIPRLEHVSAIIASQGALLPPVPAWQPLDQMDRRILGAYLLHLAILWLDSVTSQSPMNAFLLELRSREYPTVLIKAAERLTPAAGQAGAKRIRTSEIAEGMKLASDLFAENGILLLTKGQVISPTIAEFLRHRHQYYGPDEVLEIDAASVA